MTSPDAEAGQVPENLPGLADAGQLREYERRAAYLRVSELEQHPDLVAGDFDLTHLQALHRYILQDVYPWAGHQRRMGEDTTAMGMAHCRPEYLDGELRRVFRAIDKRRPPTDDRDAAIAITAAHWGELTALHPFIDGNSRTQRVFFHRYLNAAGWDIDWRQIDAAAVHAARHVAMATVDSSYLAAVLEPGVVRYGDIDSGSLRATQGHRDTTRAVDLFDAMMTHKRAGGTGATFATTMNTPAPTAAERAARIATRGISRRSPTAAPNQQSSGIYRPSLGSGPATDRDYGR